MIHRRLASLLLLILAAAPAVGAPGAFTPTGPFGVMSFGVEELIFAAGDPHQLLARTTTEVFASHDGGASWRSLLSGLGYPAPRQVVADPDDSRRFYVVLDGARILVTIDGGRTFGDLPLPVVPGPDDYLYLFGDAAAGATLVIELGLDIGGNLQIRRYASRDRGATWQEIGHPGWPNNEWLIAVHDGTVYSRTDRYQLATGASTDDPFESPIRAGAQMVFDPQRTDTFFVALDNFAVYKTTDRGASFRAVHIPSTLSPFRFLVQSAKNPDHLAAASRNSLALSFDRGETWTEEPLGAARDAAFDPASGELLLAGQGLFRRHQGGSFGPPLPLAGFDGSRIFALAARGGDALAVDAVGRTFFRAGEGPWRAGGSLPGDGIEAECAGNVALLMLGQPGKALAGCYTGAVYLTSDNGATWTRSPGSPPFGFSESTQLAAAGDTLYLLHAARIYRSTTGGASWLDLAGLIVPSSMAVHPDPTKGLLVVSAEGRLARFFPGPGFPPVAPGLPEGVSQGLGVAVIANSPAFPNLVYGVRRGLLSRSLDFGITWTPIRQLTDDVLPPPYRWDELAPLPRLLIDPTDSDHVIFLGQHVETFDGGLSFVATPEAQSVYGSFDLLVPGRFLGAQENQSGVFERTARLPACPASAEAWCAGNGRYLLSVDWKDFGGQVGKAKKVETGSEDSGIFYFFDPANWELLVKVLDGCALNQRQWLYAGGTTDVEYVLRAEDRWTGQIRHYYNAPGEPAPAITDGLAFAGCDAEPPPGARPATLASASLLAAGEPQLGLLGGRFIASARWTNFTGQSGDALTAPLRSDNSGLFYFFSPDNWEMLVKVLDGCAINNHYWVLAAATTDVGYELSIADANGGATKVYRNPVGRASPAQIDLEAFACR